MILLLLSDHSNVDLIVFSKDVYDTHRGEKAATVDWVLLLRNGDVPKILHEVQLEDNCKDNFGSLISYTVICANRTGKDTYDGDPGDHL